MLTSRSLYNRGLQTCEKAGSTKPPLLKRFDKIFCARKKDGNSERHPFLEKVFLLLIGCSKNYIMYWGGYAIIIASPFAKVCTKKYFFNKKFCAG